MKAKSMESECCASIAQVGETPACCSVAQDGAQVPQEANTLPPADSHLCPQPPSLGFIFGSSLSFVPSLLPPPPSVLFPNPFTTSQRYGPSSVKSLVRGCSPLRSGLIPPPPPRPLRCLLLLPKAATSQTTLPLSSQPSSGSQRTPVSWARSLPCSFFSIPSFSVIYLPGTLSPLRSSPSLFLGVPLRETQRVRVAFSTLGLVASCSLFPTFLPLMVPFVDSSGVIRVRTFVYCFAC